MLNEEKKIFTEEDLKIDEKNYLWTKNILSFLEKIIKLNIKMRRLDNQIISGDIFVFNHFSRLETFIPQYVFYKKENVICRSIASSVFFQEKKIAQYLLSIGAIPSDFPEIIDFCAREILKGLKIIVFPEGGMIKDKKVIDQAGKLSIYSRELKIHREPHTGSAIIALKAQRYKELFLLALKNKNNKAIEKYGQLFSHELDIESIKKKALTPTYIVPANITFFPLRTTENFIYKAVDIFMNVTNPRIRDELLIESNLLLKNTDMDITLGAPIPITKYISVFDTRLTNIFYHIETTKIPIKKVKAENLIKQVIKHRNSNIAVKIRNEYMDNIYKLVTINPLHLASELLFQLLNNKKEKIALKKFYEYIYIAIKMIQKYKNLELHQSIRFPERFYTILEGQDENLLNFLQLSQEEQLIKIDNDYLTISNNLLILPPFDEIRIKNTPMVLKNESQPIYEIKEIVASILNENDKYLDNQISDFLFEDENKRFVLACEKFKDEKYESLNIQEKDNISGNPFFLKKTNGNKKNIGILLTHGFSASPAEMFYLGENLHKEGYSVLGVRLEGHGTSPYNLANCEWLDWYNSVERGYHILSKCTDEIILIGFSMGGALSLKFAAKNENKISKIVSISSPIMARDRYGRYLFLLPIVDKINKIAKTFGAGEAGLIDFIALEPENKKTNYKHTSLNGIYELIKLVNKLKPELKNINQPLLILHADNDPEIDPESAQIIYDEVSSGNKTLNLIKSSKHVIINYPEILEKILKFIAD